MVDLKLFSVFLVVLLTTSSFCYAGRSKFSGSRENVEVLKHLKRLNKPAVKTIESPDGDIVDCVLISYQPAFDHPLLKNHTIQTVPSYHPNWRNDDSSPKVEVIPQLWHLNGECPEGTIPIRRTRKEDILRASSVESYGKKNFTALQRIGQTNHIHSIVEVDGEFYGTKATFNVWNPRIQKSNEFSLGQLWLLAGPHEEGNTIEVGWHVFPSMYYGDYNTRLFIYWTTDNYQKTGCYNLCGGFVQTSRVTMIGGSLFPISQLQGFQSELNIHVWKDPKEGNWWLEIGNGNILGYWPSIIFSHLSTSASAVQFGGEVMTFALTGAHTATQMGSGQFAEQGYGASSYIRNIQVVDPSNKLVNPKYLISYSEEGNCYDVKMGYNDVWGTYMYYGGPGRNPNCP